MSLDEAIGPEEGEAAAVPPAIPAPPPVLDYSRLAPVHLSPLVTVATYTQVIEADLARLKLEDAGIEAVLANDNGVALGPYAAGFRGALLQVREADAARAREVLDGVEQRRQERLEAAAVKESEVKCPRCGGPDVARRPVSAGAVAWVLAVVGAFALAADWRYAAAAWGAAAVVSFVLGWERFKCRGCGCAWTKEGGGDEETPDEESPGG